MNKEKLGNIFLYYKEKKDRNLYEKIENKEYKIVKIFKNDQRSYVSLLDINGEKFVYKQPIEKNNRKWQRFLSIFRGSESRREFRNIIKISEVGLNGAEPHLAVEKKDGLIVIDSYLVYSYVDGRESTYEDIDVISQELRKIHDLGFLHGDSHLNNFLIKDGKVYLIDTKLEKNKYGNFGKNFEFMYLEESCPEKIEFDKDNIYFKGARMLRGYLTLLSKFKMKLKNIRRRRK